MIENKFLKVCYFYIIPSWLGRGNMRKNQSAGWTKLLRQTPWLEKIQAKCPPRMCAQIVKRPLLFTHPSNRFDMFHRVQPLISCLVSDVLMSPIKFILDQAGGEKRNCKKKKQQQARLMCLPEGLMWRLSLPPFTDMYTGPYSLP